MIKLLLSLYGTNLRSCSPAFNRHSLRLTADESCWHLADGVAQVPDTDDPEWSGTFQLSRIRSGFSYTLYRVHLSGLAAAPWPHWRMCRLFLEWDGTPAEVQPALFYDQPTDVPSGMTHFSFTWGADAEPGSQMFVTMRREA